MRGARVPLFEDMAHAIRGDAAASFGRAAAPLNAFESRLGQVNGVITRTTSRGISAHCAEGTAHDSGNGSTKCKAHSGGKNAPQRGMTSRFADAKHQAIGCAKTRTDCRVDKRLAQKLQQQGRESPEHHYLSVKFHDCPLQISQD